MVTVNQLKELNKRINGLKDKNASAVAELRVLESQLDAKLQELSAQLGVQVTPDNITQLYQQAQQQLTEKVAKVEELLKDLTTHDVQPAQNNGLFNFNMPGTSAAQQPFIPTQHAQQPVLPTQPAFMAAQQIDGDTAVPASVSNFGTATSFVI